MYFGGKEVPVRYFVLRGSRSKTNQRRECWYDVEFICGLNQQSVTESASPASLVSLYLLFMSLAVWAMAVMVSSKPTLCLDSISLLAMVQSCPRLNSAECASLDARHLHVSGDRVTCHSQMMLQCRFSGIFEDARRSIVCSRNQCSSHRRCVH